MTRRFVMLGALSAALAVVAGAFGAHALQGALDARRFNAFEVAARYQMYHSLALFVVAWWGATHSKGAFRRTLAAGYFFLCGLVLFSGSLYVYALSGVREFAQVTPIGGLCFVLGWGALFMSTFRRN